MKFLYRLVAALLILILIAVAYHAHGLWAIWFTGMASQLHGHEQHDRDHLGHKHIGHDSDKHTGHEHISHDHLSHHHIGHGSKSRDRVDSKLPNAGRIVRLDNSPRHVEAKTDIRTIDLLRIVNDKYEPPLNVSRSIFSRILKQKKLPPTYRDAGSDWEKEKTLTVIVVPHSHNDPGWHKTVDEYFEDQTRHTLDNMVTKLLQYPLMTFVWAETVFLSMWWRDLDDDMRRAVRSLIARRQLEIVVGSWVVPDEANPHYYALIDQMIEGHQWLERNLGVKPRNTWSLDPFGYSSVLPYLYRRAGFENMVVLRVHTDVKEELERRKALEFRWKQEWDWSENDTEIQTLMMPYALYNIKHSCGPDAQVCLQFDFRQIPGEVSESRSHTVNEGNARAQARLLLTQYRLKADLFRHNVVLVPLGDDFRFDRVLEWDQQYSNYQRLFDAMNSEKSWNVHARFGTLQDYFDEVRQQAAADPETNVFPTLSGDFFPYTDHNREYWTGYFSTRPFIKSLGRDVEVHLRSADILHCLALFRRSMATPPGGKGRSYGEFRGRERLSEARQHLALFQHHDAITGTARSPVAADYEARLTAALSLTRAVVKDAILVLYPPATNDVHVNIRVLDGPNERMLAPRATILHVPTTGCALVVFNSVGYARRELIKLTVDRSAVVVTDAAGQKIAGQISSAWNGSETIDGAYELAFFAELPSLSIVAFGLAPGESGVRVSVVTKYGEEEEAKEEDVIAMDNGIIRARFSLRLGRIISFGPIAGEGSKSDGDSNPDAISIQLLTYASGRSGAYIFSPEGPASAEHFAERPTVALVKGPLFSEIRLVYEYATQIIRLVDGSSTLEIDNIVDIRELDDRELIMRINSTIKNGALFHTDQNGFGSARRVRMGNFPPEANYYPASSMVFVEESARRLTLITAQPVGVSSQGEGSVEAMLDRRMYRDDERGMGEGIEDNRAVASRFYLLVERLAGPEIGPGSAGLEKDASVVPEKDAGLGLEKHLDVGPEIDLGNGPEIFPGTGPEKYPGAGPQRRVASLAALKLADSLRNYPMVTWSKGHDFRRLPEDYSALRAGLPCDMEIVSLRDLSAGNQSESRVALVLRWMDRGDVYYRTKEPGRDGLGKGDESRGQEGCGETVRTVRPGRMFTDAKVSEVTQTSLSLMYDEPGGLEPEREVSLQRNHLYAFKLAYN